MTLSQSRVSPYRFEWRQNSRERVFKLAGTVDESTAARLRSGIIDLGSRRLLIDLSDVTSIEPEGVSALIQLAERLGRARITVVLETDDLVGLRASDLVDLEMSRGSV